MNRLKFLVTAIAFIVLAMGIYSCTKEDKSKVNVPVISNSFGETCFETLSCNDYKTEIINNVTLPEYPGCVFRVQVSICKLQDIVLGTEIFVGNYKLLDASECPALWNEWSNLVLDTASMPGEINDFINKLDLQVYSRLEDYFYAKHGNIVGCGSPLGTLIISFIKTTCNTVCAHEYDRKDDYELGEAFNNEITESRAMGRYGILVRTNCDTNGCCQRRTNLCYDPVKNEVVKTTTSHTTFTATCTGGIPDQPPTGNGVYINCLPCSFTCN